MIRTAALIAIVLPLASLAACKSRTASSQLEGDVERSEYPPALGYHFGEYRYLAPYGDRSGNAFSATEWQAMPSSRYPTSASGLYVAQHPAYNEIYGQEAFERKDTSWLMMVGISEACREYDRVLWHRSAIHLDKRFAASTALKESFGTVDAFLERCAAAQKEEKPVAECEAATKSFFDEFNIKLIRDTRWYGEGFWIVHDPSCIETIKASPASALWALGHTKDFWMKSPFTDERERRFAEIPGTSALMILARAIYEIGAPAELQKLLLPIRANVASSDLQGIRESVDRMIDATLGCAEVDRHASIRGTFGKLVDQFTKSRGFKSHINLWFRDLDALACPSPNLSQINANPDSSDGHGARDGAPSDAWPNNLGQTWTNTAPQKIAVQLEPGAYAVEVSFQGTGRLTVELATASGDVIKTLVDNMHGDPTQAIVKIEDQGTYFLRVTPMNTVSRWTIKELIPKLISALPRKMTGTAAHVSNVFEAKAGAEIDLDASHIGNAYFGIRIIDTKTGNFELLVNTSGSFQGRRRHRFEKDGHYVLFVALGGFSEDTTGTWTLGVEQTGD